MELRGAPRSEASRILRGKPRSEASRILRGKPAETILTCRPVNAIFRQAMNTISIKRLIILGAAVGAIVLGGCASPQVADSRAPAGNAAYPWTARPIKNNPADFEFAIVADRTGAFRPGIFEKAISQLNLLQPEFVMCVGDLIEGKSEDPAVLKQEYDEMDTLLNKLDMRFFRVAGNHDISNHAMLDIYSRRYGSPFYHFLYQNVLFLVISTEDPDKSAISDAQVADMRRTLAGNPDVRWTFVFMHEPLFVDILGIQNKGWSQIEDALKDRPHTVFAGHLHTYSRMQKHGRDYINLATTGGASEMTGPAAGKFDAITLVTMTDSGPVIANLLLDGILDVKGMPACEATDLK